MNNGIIEKTPYMVPESIFGTQNNAASIPMPIEKIGFRPNQLSGLELWLDAGDFSTLGVNAIGPGGVTNGGPVRFWGDKSGFRRHAIQESSNDSNCMFYRANNTGPLGCLGNTFGFPGWFYNFNTSVPPAPCTLFCVMEYINTPNQGIGGSYFSWIPPRITGTESDWNTAGGAVITAGNFTYVTPTVSFSTFGFFSNIRLIDVFKYAYRTSASHTRYCSVPVATTRQTVTSQHPLINTIGYVINSRWTSGSVGTTIPMRATNFYEIIYYARSLSDSEELQIVNYLREKWNVGTYIPPATPDADANAYLAAVETADQQILETTTRDAIANFIIGCKTDGIWSAIKSSCILMGARTLSGALVPLAGTAPTNVNFVTADYDRKTGLLGNGTTKYLNTNRAGNADNQNDFHAAVYGSNFDTGTKYWLGSSDNSTVKNAQLYHLDGSFYFDNRQQFASNMSGVITLPSSGTVCLAGTNRISVSTSDGRFNNTNFVSTNTSATPTSQNYFTFASNIAATPSGYSTARLSFYSIGSSINLSLLEARLSTLYAAISGAF